MKYNFSAIAFACILLYSCSKQEDIRYITSYVTTADKSRLFSVDSITLTNIPSAGQVIYIDTAKIFQSMDGFGYSLTGGSAYLIHHKISHEAKDQLLNELFGHSVNSIGVSYLRISIGASDLDAKPFTYNDLPHGKTDKELIGFTIDEDRKNLIPVLKDILTISPQIKIMGSPWSAPAWMKDNNSLKGGSLKPEFYGIYANYLVKYIKAYEQEGIKIDAITIQNEPENPKNNPSMVMTAFEQAALIKNHLGPTFKKAGIKTKIVTFDHNCDHPEYPISILNDADAKKYIDGSAFHLYLGEIDALSKTHDAHPDKNIYFTEQWTSSKGDFSEDLKWHLKNLIIGAPRNWSRNVLEWNLAADADLNPHTDEGGCTMCLGALTIGDSITRNVSYYIIAHASKFVVPGSKRIDSNLLNGLPNVAFITPAGEKILIVLNDSVESKKFSIVQNNVSALAELPAGAVGTYIIK